MEKTRSLLEKGFQHHQEGRLRRAEEFYLRVLRADPNNPDGLNLLAVVANETGRAQEAIALMEKAVRAAPGNPEFSNNLGQLYKNCGQVDEAIEAYRAALNADPDFADAHNNLGNALTMTERLEDAIGHYRRALEIDPNNVRVHYNLATTQSKQGNLSAAIEGLRTVIGIDPDYTDAYNNLGIALNGLGRLEEAVDSYRMALILRPDYAEAHYNLGLAYQEQGRLNEAVASYHKALAIKPDYADAHNNLSQTLLLQGKLEEGWAEYEWRFRSDEKTRQRSFPQAPWAGEPVDGKTVLVWAEQGVGDEVMFAGMVPDLVEAGANVILESDPRLVPLFERSFDGVECLPKKVPPVAETEQGSIDFQAPGGNLGRWLRPNLESFPGRQSYLVADADRAAALRDQYWDGTDDRLIGVAWVSKNKRIGQQKSMTLGDLAPLTGIPGVRFIDLQYGDTAKERALFEDETGTSIIHDEHVDQMSDLDAFAAQMAAMDLVISVSNTTVHMAGALGVPTWVMLNTVPLPCWMLEGDDSPWYPSVRLFRQSQAGEWADVIRRVGDALRAFAAGGSG